MNHIPGMTIYREGPESFSQGQTDVSGSSYQVRVIPTGGSAAGNTGGQNNNNNANGNSIDNADGGIEIQDAPAPLNLVDLDDEETPLASGAGIGGLLGTNEEPGARPLYMGTVILATLLLALIVLMVYLYRRASVRNGGKTQAAESRKAFNRRKK